MVIMLHVVKWSSLLDKYLVKAGYTQDKGRLHLEYGKVTLGIV